MASLMLVLAFSLEAPAPESAYADEAHSKVAQESEMATSHALLLEGMKPIKGNQVKARERYVAL
jgi:hypothetical protein